MDGLAHRRGDPTADLLRHAMQWMGIEMRISAADQLPARATELAPRQVTLIVTTETANEALAAKAATSAIPIVS